MLVLRKPPSAGVKEDAWASRVPPQVEEMLALRVYFADNSYRTVLLRDDSATALEVCASVASLIGLPQRYAGCCALFEVSLDEPMQRPLADTEHPSVLVRRWDLHAKMRLVFMVRLHTALLARGDCAPALWLLLIEGAREMAAGLTPCGPRQSLSLAASQCIARWGAPTEEDDSGLHAGEFARRVEELVSPPGLRARTQPELWGRRIAEQVDALSDAQTSEKKKDLFGAARRFVDLTHQTQRPCCGHALFACAPRSHPQELPPRIIVSVSRNGLGLHSLDLSLIRSFALTELATWGFHPSLDFYFETIGARSRWVLSMVEGAQVAQLLHAHAMSAMLDSQNEDFEDDESHGGDGGYLRCAGTDRAVLLSVADDDEDDEDPDLGKHDEGISGYAETPAPSPEPTALSPAPSVRATPPPPAPALAPLAPMPPPPPPPPPLASLPRPATQTVKAPVPAPTPVPTAVLSTEPPSPSTPSVTARPEAPSEQISQPHSRQHPDAMIDTARLRDTPTLHHHRVAVKLQAIFRGFWLRSWWEREDAALHIQAFARGYRVRSDLFTAMNEHGAVHIQAVVRGFLVRCDFLRAISDEHRFQ